MRLTRTSQRAALAISLVLLLAACGSTASPSPGLPSAVASAIPGPTTGATTTPSPSPAALWRDVTDDAIGTTGEWTNKVEVADINGDGRPDLLFANGGEYEVPGEPEPARVFVNDGAGRFTEATEATFGSARFLSRVIKVADLDADGTADIVVGGTYATQTRLYRGTGDGFVDVTADSLPAAELSIGDLEPGDVDADGDLDLMLADWGTGSPMSNAGGRTRLWRNDGGRFVDATDEAMPDALVSFSWELELLDVDDDWDLDAVISCKRCEGSFLFENDGQGRFTDVSDGRMPQFTNNYEFEPMDVDGDSDLDLATINDGQSFGEHLFRNDRGTFTDATAEWWPAPANPGYDDNIVVFLDVDSDGDADFLVGSLDGPDRLLINDGQGTYSLRTSIFDGAVAPTRGTLGLAVADFDGDGRLDIVESQGEVPGFESERIYLGSEIAPDTAPPSVTLGPVEAGPAGLEIVARVHDRKSPSRSTDWRAVAVRWGPGAGIADGSMTWFGEYLWRATVAVPAGASSVTVCATDAAGNEACADAVDVPSP